MSAQDQLRQIIYGMKKPSGGGVIFHDDFTDGTLDSFWTNMSDGSGSIAETGGSLVFTATGTNGKPGVRSVSSYDFSSGKYAEAELIDVSAPTGGGAQVIHQVLGISANTGTDTSQSVWWIYNNSGSLYLRMLKEDVGIVGTDFAYNSTTHRFFRLEVSGGTLYYKTSPDGSTWTTHHSTAFVGASKYIRSRSWAYAFISTESFKMTSFETGNL